MAIGFLAAAVILAVLLDHVYPAVPDSRGETAPVAVTGVALARWVVFGERLPFTMQGGDPALPVHPGRPTCPPMCAAVVSGPFSGLQSAMTWQAVNRMHYSQAGGGGPQGEATGPAPPSPGSGS